MKKFFLFLISFLIGIGLFIWIVKSVGWQEVKNTFLIFTGWQGIVIFILTLFITLAATWKWREVLKAEGINISFSNLYKTYFAGFSIMYLFPVVFLGGEVLQSYILKRKYSIRWSKGMASVITNQILDWTTSLVVIFFGVIFFLFKISLLPTKMLIIFFGIFLFCLVGISIFYFIAFKKESIIEFFFRHLNHKGENSEVLETEREIFKFFRIKNLYFWKGLFLAFFEEAFFLLRIWFLVSFLGKDIGFLFTLSILGFSYLAKMIPIPAVLGVHEGIQTFAFNALGLGKGFGTAFTMIIRGADLIIAFTGIFILSRFGLQLLENTLFKNSKG